MKKKLDSLYSIVLGFLIVASIIQTGRLWYDPGSNYNPFYRSTRISLPAKEQRDETTTNSYLTNPKSLAVYKSNLEPSFALIESTKAVYESIYNRSYSIIKGIAQGGTIGEVEELDYSKFWEGVQGSILLSYNYKINDNILKEELGIDAKIGLDGIEDANLIVIEILKTGNKEANIYFANTDSGKMIRVSMYMQDGGKYFEKLYMIQNENISGETSKTTLFQYLEDKSDIDYSFISSIRSGKNFAKNVFLRDKNKSFYTDSHAGIQIPYVEDHKVKNDVELQSFIYKMFKNPNSVEDVRGIDDRNYIFIANGLIIKYENTGLLTYKQTVREEEETTEQVAYSEAVAFLDNLNWEEFSLKAYNKDSNGIYHFYFGYNRYTFPVMLDGLEMLDMPYPIEITVKSGKIEEAKVVVIEQKATNQSDISEFKDDYVRVLDQVVEENDIKGEKIYQDIYYAFVKDDETDQYIMSWVVQVNDNVYHVPVKQGGE